MALLSVRQDDARYVRPGLPVEFHTDHARRTFRGTVAWLSPTIDERSRSRCGFASCSAIRILRLRDKSFGTARILLRSEPHAIVVRRDAVQSTAGSQFVFVRDKDYLKADHPKVFHVRQVRIGASDDEYVELLAGASRAKSSPRRAAPRCLRNCSAAASAKAVVAANKKSDIGIDK